MQDLAAHDGHNGEVTMKHQYVSSLQQLESKNGPFDGIIVAAGAAANSIEELELPLSLQQVTSRPSLKENCYIGCTIHLVAG